MSMTPVARRADLTRGARAAWGVLVTVRARDGGLRRVGRNRLAALLGCSPRTVSRFTGELVAAGLVERVPARRVRRPDGAWRCRGPASYRLAGALGHPRPTLAPRHRRRSDRGDTPDTPPPYGGPGDPPTPPVGAGRHRFRSLEPDGPPFLAGVCVCGLPAGNRRHTRA